ncbi:hypothetical protein HIM_07840 [Hirsutella minnesotensis 3608]|uniref:Rhodopsin domain-containing protein n=1 Tax=Hirsutella minnesotensis 3608 TaxID=1043627 RepID=A0A0F7ZMX6_9HYPO|nr:hypothetical protein HIM_07840 [Hirsutella minnesotensis 3608]
MSNPHHPSPEYIGYQLEAFIGVFTTVEIIAVALRFYARHLTDSKYDAGDYLIVAALIGQIVAGAIAVSTVRHAGVGYHVDYLLETDPGKVTTFFKYLVAMSTWYATTESLAKLAICFLYKRIFPQKAIRIIINLTMVVLICASIAGALADLFGCTPFSAHWGTPKEQAIHCIDVEALFVWGSFPNIVTDIILLVVPIPTLWNLQASTGMRVSLIITFLFGSVGTVTSVMRFVAFYNRSSFVDATYSAVGLIIWTVCEPGAYLIAACLLMYRPLLNKLGVSMITGSRVKSHGNGRSKAFGLRKSRQAGSGSTSHKCLRTIGGGPMGDIEDGDEVALKPTKGIRATTDVDVVWESSDK